MLPLSAVGLVARRCAVSGRLFWRRLAVASLVWCAAGVAIAQACTELVATGNPEYPPYLWRAASGQELVGANADLMQLVSKEIGIPIRVRYVGTWARVQEEARHGRVDLIAGAFLNLPRLEYMDYVHPAFQVTRSMVWARAGTRMPYERWSDLQGRSGVTVINNSFGQEFDRYAKASLKIDAVASLEQALRMVEKGRVDYLIYEEAPAQAYIARLGVEGLAPLAPAISNESLYLTLSHKSRCNTPELRGKLAKAMYALERKNAMKPLVEQSVRAWRTPR